MSDDRLDQIRQRRAAISDTPWTVDDQGRIRDATRDVVTDVWWDAMNDEGGMAISEADAEFIAHAPADIDWLIREVEAERILRVKSEQRIGELMEQVERLREDAGRVG